MHRFSKKNKIILPAITTLERIVWEARAMAEKKLFNTVSQSLTNEQKEKLEDIITLQHSSESNKTILGWLKEPRDILHPKPFKSNRTTRIHTRNGIRNGAN